MSPRSFAHTEETRHPFDAPLRARRSTVRAPSSPPQNPPRIRNSYATTGSAIHPSAQFNRRKSADQFPGGAHRWRNENLPRRYWISSRRAVTMAHMRIVIDTIPPRHRER